MNKKNILIIGYGSIGRLHYKILNSYKFIDNIYVITKQKISKKNFISSINGIKDYNPDYIIIASETHKHFSDMKFIEKKFKDKIVLVEKPISNSIFKHKFKNNKYFVNYNLRFNPITIYLKKYINMSNFFLLTCKCSSFLPNWRHNIDYFNSYSADKLKGGGVEYDLSHELDFVNYFLDDIEYNFIYKKKISNLQISSNDYLFMHGKNKKGNHVNIQLNYFGLDEERVYYFYGKNNTIEANFNKSYIKFHEANKSRLIKFKKISREYTYDQTHKLLLKKNYDNICNLMDAKKILKQIIK